MPAGIYNFSIYQGDTFTRFFKYETRASETATPVAVNLTGCSVKSQIRVKEDKTSQLLAEFTTSITDAVNGKFKLTLTPTQTAALSFKVAYYDIQVTFTDGSIITPIEGRVVLNKEVTHG